MKIPFEEHYRKKYYALLDKVFDSNFWSEGPMLEMFEEKFSEFINLPSVGISNGGTGLLAILEYIDVIGRDVIVPANTFWATAQAAKKAGANVVYADCNRNDLCISFEDIQSKVTDNTKAVIVVHIGGHIAFDIEKIVDFCDQRNITVIEDCAHVHGGCYNGKTGGHFGFAGAYSFYATKTMPLGEGGMVCSRNLEFLSWLKKYRNYGKEIVNGRVTYPVKNGFNMRMNNFTTALGLVQLERLPEILEWKRMVAEKYDRIFEKKIELPDGMTSGYYKYIIFDDIELTEKTGKVFDETDFGNEIEGVRLELPNSYWVARNHQCPPIYYGWEGADLSVEDIRLRVIKK